MDCSIKRLFASFAACLPLIAAAQSPIATVQEFLNRFTGHYFMTADSAEANGIRAGVAGPGWNDTGFTYTVSAGGVDVCRFYAPAPTNSHFYTADPAECDFLKTHDTGWQYEGVAFKAEVPKAGVCGTGLTPVTRLYNNRAAALDSNHRFAWDDRAIAHMQSQGWIVEGVAFCARSTRRDELVFDVFMSPVLPVSPYCTMGTGNESCIALTGLPEMNQQLNSWLPGNPAPPNPAYTKDFAAKTGWIANVDTVHAASFADRPAEHSFVEYFFGGQVIGSHVVGADRRVSESLSISPTIHARHPTGVPLVPWPDRGEHDMIVNFQMKVGLVARANESAQAYAGPVFEFRDQKSGQHMLLRVLAFGSQPPTDFVGADPATGLAMVSTTFAAPRFGRVLKGRYITCAFATVAAGGCPMPGIDYSFRIDQDDFANALSIARTVNGSLSGDVRDYVSLGMQIRNETYGDAELGILENWIQFIVTK